MTLCAAGWKYYSGTHSYFYVSTTKADHPTARAECERKGADLASITDQDEMNFVVSISWVISHVYAAFIERSHGLYSSSTSSCLRTKLPLKEGAMPYRHLPVTLSWACLGPQKRAPISTRLVSFFHKVSRSHPTWLDDARGGPMCYKLTELHYGP